MSLNPKDFNPALLSGDKPVAHTGANEFSTIALKYTGDGFAFFVPPPGAGGTPITENPKKANQLSQGVVLDTPELVQFATSATEKIKEIIFAAKDDENMPAFCKNWTSVDSIEQTITMLGGNFKMPLAYAMKKDDNGKKTNQRNTDLSPVMWCKMIQCGPNPSKKEHKPWQIFTKYYSAAVLAGHNKAAIASGQKTESEFLYDPINLMKRKLKMRFMASVTISDVYIAPGKVIVRMAISEAYILKFEEMESQARKNIAAAVMTSGMDLSGPGAMPEAPVDEDDGVEPSSLPTNTEFEVVVEN